MKRLFALLLLTSAMIARAGTPGLAWDAESKDVSPKPGETSARLEFTVTNVSPAEIVIRDAQPSCGCTVASMPAKPWKLAPGASGRIVLAVDLKGKSGTLIKTLNVLSSVGNKDLVFRVKLPDGLLSSSNLEERVRRLRNQKQAAADRQGVFRGDCARCHVEPTVGKLGKELYQAACGICHDAAHRATMVPDLTGLPLGNNRDYWRVAISQGKEGTLMPAFARAAGGPLSEEQIASLVEYLATRPPAGK